MVEAIVILGNLLPMSDQVVPFKLLLWSRIIHRNASGSYIELLAWLHELGICCLLLWYQWRQREDGSHDRLLELGTTFSVSIRMCNRTASPVQSNGT